MSAGEFGGVGRDSGDGVRRNIPLLPILLVNFIGTLGFSIVIPFLVFLVTKFGGNALVYGLIGAAYPAFQLIGGPILGNWSDVYGRRKILLLSQAGTTLSWLFFLAALLIPITVLSQVESPLLGSFSLTIPLLILFFARALDGITGGNVSVANAYIADITTEPLRKRNFGRMAISSNLGFIIGPALAGILGGTILKEMLPVIGALFISAAATIIIARYLPESRPVRLNRDPECLNVKKVFGQEHKSCVKLREKSGIKTRDILKIRHVPFTLLLYFLVFLGFNIFYTAFPIHAVQGLDWTLAKMGAFFALISFLMVIVQGPVLARISGKASDHLLIIVGSIILGTNFLLLLSGNDVWIFAAAVLFAVGNGLMWPSMLSLLSRLAGEAFQGSVHGFAGGIGSAASILGLIAGGLMYTQIKSVTFAISAVIIYCVFGLSLRLVIIERAGRRKRPTPVAGTDEDPNQKEKP